MLRAFGRNACDLVFEPNMIRAEEFLVKVLKSSEQYAKCTTMDELRYAMYHHQSSTTIENLPPTSFSIRQHIL